MLINIQIIYTTQSQHLEVACLNYRISNIRNTTVIMPPVLAYWDIRGLAQPIRLLLNYVGQDFEDKFYVTGPGPDFSKDDWLSVKYKFGMDFPNLPYYIDGDRKITQSNAILRYLGRKYDMCGSTEDERIIVDIMADQVMDLRNDFIMLSYYSPNFDTAAEAYKKALPAKLKIFEDFMGDKSFPVGEKITFPDFHLYEMLDQHKALDPTCLDQFPKLQAFVERFENLPAIKKYMESDKFMRAPINDRQADFGNK